MSAPVIRRRPGPRRALSEDEVLDAALSLIDDEPDAAAATGDRAFAAMPAEHFPRSAAAAAMAGYICTEQYLRGLRRVLDGITDRVAESPERPVPTP